MRKPHIVALSAFKTSDAVYVIRIFVYLQVHGTDLLAEIALCAVITNFKGHHAMFVEQGVDCAKRTDHAAERAFYQDKKDQEEGKETDLYPEPETNSMKIKNRRIGMRIYRIPGYPWNSPFQRPLGTDMRKPVLAC